MKPEPLDQHADTTGLTASSEWLTPFAQDATARRLVEAEARLQADADLVMRLALTSYQGPDWDAVAGLLAAYGVRVLTAWILDGTIRRRCMDKGWPGPWDGTCRSYDVARDLAADTVVVALEKFRDSVLIPGRWSPNGGASLATYFIGQCLLRWANVHQRWTRYRKNQLPQPPYGAIEQESSTGDDVHQVLDRMELDGLAPATSLVRWILQLRDAGYEWDEIAELTGKSAGSVRGLVRRLRESARTNSHTKEEAS